jgi:hypothetical protein
MNTPPFRVLDAEMPDDASEWRRLWTLWPRREPFAHPAYVRSFAAAEGRVLCAAWDSPDGSVIYPFILRDITQSADQTRPHDARSRDTTTPYGYGGAFCWDASDRDRLASLFWASYDAWANNEGVVSEFVRLHLVPDDLLPYPGQLVERQVNVVRRLDLALDLMWMDFEHKVRKNVNKARRCGVEVVVDSGGERLDDFLRIYEKTMDRREAAAGYYFARSSFECLAREAPGAFVYLHALVEGKVVSTELVLVGADNIYSFLGGTDSEFFDSRPNDLLKFEIIRWGIENRKKRFVMGGGYQPDDGIFRYKKSFAPGGAVPFFVGRRILQQANYGRLLAERAEAARAVGNEWRPSGDFFPAYRAKDA